jgi:predicted short-subunit dehydrogenase-like oxidoreductase (DUF2520 family)
MTKISIIGPGRVGGALAIALSGRGFAIESIASKRPDAGADIAERSGARIVGADDLGALNGEIILITTRDDQIEGVVRELAVHSHLSGTCFLHTSGSRTSALLSPLREQGSEVGSIHPLVSISDAVLGASRFEGAYFCIEGDAGAVESAKKIADALGGRPFEIATDKKPLYHAAAVMACGHLVALISEAVEMLSICGPGEDESKRILFPLIESTLRNLHEQPFEEALTGPFARADVETFRSHLAAFENEVAEEIVSAYLLLGARSLDLAIRRNPGSIGPESFLELVKDILRVRSGG